MSRFLPKKIFGRLFEGLKDRRVEPVSLNQYLIMRLYVYAEFLDIDEVFDSPEEVDAHELTDVVVESAVQTLREIKQNQEYLKGKYYTTYSFSDDTLTDEEEWIVKKMMFILMLDWGVYLDYIDYNKVCVKLLNQPSWRTE